MLTTAPQQNCPAEQADSHVAGTPGIDTLADLATSSLAAILSDDTASPSLKRAAAADALRFVTAERKRADATRRRLAQQAPDPAPVAVPAPAQPQKEYRQPARPLDVRSGDTEDSLSIAGLNPYQRAMLNECRRQLIEFNGPDPSVNLDDDDDDIEVDEDDEDLDIGDDLPEDDSDARVDAMLRRDDRSGAANTS